MGAEAILDINNFHIYIKKNKTAFTLYPKFMVNAGGKIGYTLAFNDESTTFCGWLPYHFKKWPVANEKLKFKKFATDSGIKTPAFTQNNDLIAHAVLIKKNSSSFGKEIRGPYPNNQGLVLDPHAEEYFEQFIYGKILKVWYWNGKPICQEIDTMATLSGNGKHSVTALMAQRLRRYAKLDENQIKHLMQTGYAMLQLQGVSPEHILNSGESVIVDYRYGSEFLLPKDRSSTWFSNNPKPEYFENLAEIGKKIQNSIPEEIRKDTLYTTDFILDHENALWCLEVNSNPTTHPCIYAEMIESLFKTTGDE